VADPLTVYRAQGRLATIARSIVWAMSSVCLTQKDQEPNIRYRLNADNRRMRQFSC